MCVCVQRERERASENNEIIYGSLYSNELCANMFCSNKLSTLNQNTAEENTHARSDEEDLDLVSVAGGPMKTSGLERDTRVSSNLEFKSNLLQTQTSGALTPG